MEAALGMSYAGKRALCCMKHVGLNVAADCFMNAAMSGINGGMILLLLMILPCTLHKMNRITGYMVTLP